MMAGFSNVPTFSGKFESFLDRLECYFVLNGTAEEKKKFVLIMGLSDAHYDVLADLVSPQNPREMSNEDLKTILTSHFGTATNKMVERAKFREVKRSSGETISDFVARLRSKARNCLFGDALEENPIEQLRIGINSKTVSDRLCVLSTEDQSNLKKVIDIALQVEIDEKMDRFSMQEPETVSTVRRPVQNTTQQRTRESQKTSRSRLCFRCNKPGHMASFAQCPARKRRCNICKATGHYAGSKFCKGRTGVSVVEETSVASSTDTVVQDALFSVKQPTSTMPKCELLVEGEMVQFMLDTGACKNIVDLQTYCSIKHHVKLQKTSVKLFSYGNNNQLDVLGKFEACVKCSGREVRSEFFVFNGSAKCLLSSRTARDLGLLSYSENVICTFTANEFRDVVDEYPEVFDGVGKLKGHSVKFHIDPNISPVAQPVRRLPMGFRGKVKAKLDELLAADIIEPVSGVGTSWVSPLVVVMKDSGEIRQTVDMRQANRAILRERHPIPTTTEMLANLEGGRIFSKLDLKEGFHQVELDKDSRAITTFITPFGLFRYKRLTMGTNASPELFQYVIQQALLGLEGVQNMADDIILSARNIVEHDQRMHSLLRRLKDVGLTLNPKKCQFRVKSVKFLGYIVSGKGISADPAKVKSIVEFKPPKSASECRSFMGLVNFVGRFIPDLATVAEPIRRLTHKDIRFSWGKAQNSSFEKIKTLMANCETLAHFEYGARTMVITDASPVGLGAILVQEQGGFERVVAYGHTTLSKIERKYSQTEREALAVVWACEHFMMYLLGNEFELVTDHKALEFIFNNPNSKPVPRIERWALRLQSFKFRVVYKPGKTNIADPLSRMMRQTENTPIVASIVGIEYVEQIAKQSVPIALSWSEIVTASRSCGEIRHVIKCLKRNDFVSCAMGYRSISTELNEVDGVLLRGNKLVIPRVLRQRVIELAHEGHMGIVKCKQRLRTKVWWPGIDREAEKFCRNCVECLKVSQRNPPHPLKMTKFPDKPWSFLAMDLLGPLPNGLYIVVLVDYYSRFFECALLRSTTSEKIIEFLDTVFCRFGYCDALRTDNGPQFRSEEFQRYLREGGIKWVSTTPLWPQANGEVERVNRTLLKSLKIAHSNNQNLGKELRKFLIAYRSTPHTSTGVAPFSLLFQRDMTTKLPGLEIEQDTTVHDRAADNDALSKCRNKIYADEKRSANESQIQVGESVLVQNREKGKLDPNFGNEKHTVVAREGSEVVVSDKDGRTTRRNETFVKAVPDSNINADQPNADKDIPLGEGAPTVVSARRERPQRHRKPPDRFNFS